jgi:linoleoyl-CoA desaturase
MIAAGQISAPKQTRGLQPGRTPTYSWQEINRHNRKRDCWIVVDGGVYDVTRWVDAHPGGDIICSLAGQDVSALFHSSHFRDVTGLLKSFKIGTVASPVKTVTYASPFLLTLKERVHQHFAANNIDYRRTRLLRNQVIASIAAFSIAWLAVYVCHLYLVVVAMGLISCAMVGGFAHEYCHSTLIRDGNRMNASSIAHSVIWAFICPFMFEKHFQYEHFSHHIFPLNEEFDYEVFALQRVLRLSPTIQYRPIFRYQHYYAPVVYSLYITIQVIVGFTSSFFDRRNFSTEKSFSFHVYAIPLVTLTLHVVLPILFVGVYWWMICFLVYNIVWQLTTYVVAAVVHMTSRVECPSDDWAYIVCARSVNVLCGNWFYDWLSGGFNYQIDHHLLPAIARENLPGISHIVRQTCAEFGYPYREYRSFKDYMRDHYAYLLDLSRDNRSTPAANPMP